MNENACLYYHNLVVFAEPKGIFDEFLEVVYLQGVNVCVRLDTTF